MANRPEHATEIALHAALAGAVDMGNEIIRLRNEKERLLECMRDSHNLLSGEFYAEALGELADGLAAFTVNGRADQP